MPQLDPSSFASQIFWLFVSFGLLYFFVRSYIAPRMGAIVETRKSTIHDDLSDAARFKEQSESAIKEYEALLAKAKAESAKLISDAVKRMESEDIERSRAVNDEISERMSESEQKIGESKKRAIRDIAPVINETAREIYQKFTGEKIDDTLVKKALDLAA
jgi:F-type H+-transporting ATPase subunit b